MTNPPEQVARREHIPLILMAEKKYVPHFVINQSCIRIDRTRRNYSAVDHITDIRSRHDSVRG